MENRQRNFLDHERRALFFSMKLFPRQNHKSKSNKTQNICTRESNLFSTLIKNRRKKIFFSKSFSTKRKTSDEFIFFELPPKIRLQQRNREIRRRSVTPKDSPKKFSSAEEELIRKNYSFQFFSFSILR